MNEREITSTQRIGIHLEYKKREKSTRDKRFSFKEYTSNKGNEQKISEILTDDPRNKHSIGK